MRETRPTLSWPAYFLVAGVALFTFLPWVRGYFLGDDWMLYARNSGRPLPELLQQLSDASCSSQYRPLSELSLRLFWSLFGFNPVGHHVVNLVLHAANAVLVAVLGQRLARDRRVGLWAGLSFAVFGCHTEAVLWMTARHEMIAAGLALLGLVLYTQFRKTGKHGWWVGAFFAYVAGLGFKETVLMLPLLVGLYDLLFTLPTRQHGQQRLRVGQVIPAASLALVGLAYSLFRLRVGGAYDVPITLLGPPKNLLYYLLMETIALPASTSFLARFPWAILPVLVSLAAACVLLAWLARKQGVRNRAVWFGAGWTVIALAPVILIVAERTTYFSSVGWAWVIASLTVLAWDAAVQDNSRLRRWLVAVAAVLILGANLSTATHRAYFWDRSAGISYTVFSRVRAEMQALPPEGTEHFWFVNAPNTIEYAVAFGSRVDFAVWLLQEQAQKQVGERDVDVLLLSRRGSEPPLDEWLAQQVAERGVKGPALAFYWQDGQVVTQRVDKDVEE